MTDNTTPHNDRVHCEICHMKLNKNLIPAPLPNRLHYKGKLSYIKLHPHRGLAPRVVMATAPAKTEGFTWVELVLYRDFNPKANPAPRAPIILASLGQIVSISGF